MTYSKNYIVCCCSFFIVIVYGAFAQDTYVTQHGILYIANMDAQHPVKFYSNEIHILFNMDKAEFDFSIPIEFLHTDIDSLNNLLQKTRNSIIRINGILDLDKIYTDPHDPIRFKFIAKIQHSNTSKSLSGYGNLQHIAGNEQPACRLNLTFEVEDFELFGNYRDDFRFQVIQSILNQSTPY